jgi:hypothetical protein
VAREEMRMDMPMIAAIGIMFLRGKVGPLMAVVTLYYK